MRICAAVVIAALLLVADYFLSNFSFPLSLWNSSNFFGLFGYATQCKEDPGKTELLCVNIGVDKQLAARIDEFGDTVGHVPVTDRKVLLDFLRIAEQAEYRYLFMDIRFEKGLATDVDSTLFSVMRSLPRFVFSTHRTTDRYEIADSTLLVKGAMADYRGDTFSGFTRYEFLQDGAESVALRMYRDLTGQSISEYGPVYLSDGQLCYNLQFIPLPANLLFHYGEHGEIRYPYLGSQILGMHSKEELIEMMKDKIVIIGDFDNDLHQSYIGEVPGPLISYYAYRLLLKGGHLVKWSYLFILFVIYSLLLFLMLQNENSPEKWLGLVDIKSPLLAFFLDLITYKTILFILKCVFYLVFGMSFITTLPAVVFASISHIQSFIAAWRKNSVRSEENTNEKRSNDEKTSV